MCVLATEALVHAVKPVFVGTGFQISTAVSPVTISKIVT